jgi:hypothetical protein
MAVQEAVTEGGRYTMRVPVFQLLMIAMFVRRKRTCEAAWVRAGFTRRVSIIRKRGQYLKTVEAPNEKAAEAAAVAKFDLRLRRHCVASERIRQAQP